MDAVRMLRKAKPQQHDASAFEATGRVRRGDIAVADSRNSLEAVPERLGQVLELLAVQQPDQGAADEDRRQVRHHDEDEHVPGRRRIAHEEHHGPAERRPAPCWRRGPIGRFGMPGPSMWPPLLYPGSRSPSASRASVVIDSQDRVAWW